MMASLMGYHEIVRTLLENQADVRLKCSEKCKESSSSSDDDDDDDDDYNSSTSYRDDGDNDCYKL